MTDENPRATPRDATIEANSDSGLARPGDRRPLLERGIGEGVGHAGGHAGVDASPPLGRQGIQPGV